MKNNFKFILMIYFAYSCYNNPAIKSNYNFSNVKSIEINAIEDHPNLRGSGSMISNIISYSFLKFGFDVSQSKDENQFISLGNGNRILVLSCIITDFTDSELLIVPYKYENRGYTETVLNQSTNSKKNKKNTDVLTTTSTKTHGGSITEGNKIEYSRAKVGIIFTMKDKLTGDLVWSNSYWYSGLELHKTVESCIKQGINQLERLFD